MNGWHIAIDVLLVLGVILALLSCLGIVAMRTTLQRVHFVGLIGVPGTILTAGAVAIGGHVTSGTGLKAAFIGLVLVAFGPILAHATVQAIVARGPEDG
ncbi:MAG: monovalent cation/H(+) antiporter subunit G [Candidatus Velthaea sp.]